MTEPASELLIRPGVPSEAGQLTALVRGSKGYWGYSPLFLAQAAPELTVSEDDIAHGKVFVAELRGRPVGVYVLDLAEAPELVALFVEPDFIGKRIGQALLRQAVDRARKAGIEDLLIESDPNAERFYRAHGAVPIGHRISPTTGRELTLLRLDLAAPSHARGAGRVINQAP